MKNPLIRTRQGRLMRVVDLLATLLAWTGFFYLVGRGVFEMVRYQGPGLAARLEPVIATADTLAGYVAIAGLNACVLAAWALYNQMRRRVERRGKIPALDDAGLSASFDLTPQLLRALRSGQIVKVRNDEHGGIADVLAWGNAAMPGHPSPANDPRRQRYAGAVR